MFNFSLSVALPSYEFCYSCQGYGGIFYGLDNYYYYSDLPKLKFRVRDFEIETEINNNNLEDE